MHLIPKARSVGHFNWFCRFQRDSFQICSESTSLMLYYKFYHHYLLIEPISTIYADPTGSHSDLTRVRFRLRKKLLYQLIAFRRMYLAKALVLNMLLDSTVYAATQSFQAMVIAGFSFEALRRLMKL